MYPQQWKNDMEKRYRKTIFIKTCRFVWGDLSNYIMTTHERKWAHSNRLATRYRIQLQPHVYSHMHRSCMYSPYSWSNSGHFYYTTHTQGSNPLETAVFRLINMPHAIRSCMHKLTPTCTQQINYPNCKTLSFVGVKLQIQSMFTYSVKRGAGWHLNEGACVTEGGY